MGSEDPKDWSELTIRAGRPPPKKDCKELTFKPTHGSMAWSKNDSAAESGASNISEWG